MGYPALFVHLYPLDEKWEREMPRFVPLTVEIIMIKILNSCSVIINKISLPEEKSMILFSIKISLMVIFTNVKGGLEAPSRGLVHLLDSRVAHVYTCKYASALAYASAGVILSSHFSWYSYEASGMPFANIPAHNTPCGKTPASSSSRRRIVVETDTTRECTHVVGVVINQPASLRRNSPSFCTLRADGESAEW